MRHPALVIVIVLFVMLSGVSLAHAHEEEPETTRITLESLTSSSLNYVLIASFIVGVMIIVSFLKKEKTEKQKMALFLGIIIPVILSTAFLAGSTVYLNLVSATQGPVHWHADFEIWNCGEKLDLIDPEGFLNRVGTSVFHEHGDDRIHVEGVVVDLQNASLHHFFEVVGGELTAESFTVPTNEGMVSVRNGNECKGIGNVQVFVYKITNPDPTKRTGFTFVQQKLENFPDYILSPYSNIPPGDCIIVEFDQEKERTDHICETYRIALEKGDIQEA